MRLVYVVYKQNDEGAICSFELFETFTLGKSRAEKIITEVGNDKFFTFTEENLSPCASQDDEHQHIVYRQNYVSPVSGDVKLINEYHVCSIVVHGR